MQQIEEIIVSPKYLYRPNDEFWIEERGTGNRLEKDEPLTKILIYEDRVQGFFFEQANMLLDTKGDFSKFTGYSILLIATSQIEGMEQYRQGQISAPHKKKDAQGKSIKVQGQSKKFFRDGIRRIFLSEITSIEDESIDEFYEVLRCGLFHDGFTKKKVYLDYDYKAPLKLDVRQHSGQTKFWKINPERYLKAVEKDFAEYIEALKDAAIQPDSSKQNMLNNFLTIWDPAWKVAKEIAYGADQI